MLPLLSLPNELILEITDLLPIHDISALLKANHQLSSLLTKTLLTELFHSRSLTHGRRLLYQLASQQDLIGVKDLLARGILDFTEPETILHEAVISQTVHVLETLLHAGLDPDTKDSKRGTPLSFAVKQKRVDFVRVLAAREDVDVNWEDNNSMSPLSLAVQAGQEEAVRILVQSANIDLQPFSDNQSWNYLHLAALQESVPILRFLLDYMDPNQGDMFGQTPLHTAVGAGNYLAVECLLEDERLDVNAQEDMGETALHLAIHERHLDIVKILLAHARVEINICDRQGQNALDAAVSASRIEAARLILSSPKADVNFFGG